jgi:YD repeat-containing protein
VLRRPLEPGEYTPAGRLAAVIDPTGARSETRYGPHGEATEMVDELGQVTSRRYDGFGNVVGISAPDGAKWEMAYDALSRLVSTHDPAGATWMREYDVTGNLVASIDPIGTRYSAALNQAGQITNLSDGLTSAAFAFDELGRAVSHRRPDGTEMGATYDRCGRRTSVSDPMGTLYRRPPVDIGDPRKEAQEIVVVTAAFPQPHAGQAGSSKNLSGMGAQLPKAGPLHDCNLVDSGTEFRQLLAVTTLIAPALADIPAPGLIPAAHGHERAQDREQREADVLCDGDHDDREHKGPHDRCRAERRLRRLAGGFGHLDRR